MRDVPSAPPEHSSRQEQVKENFLGLKKFINAEWIDPVTAENILTLRRDVRRDLGRK